MSDCKHSPTVKLMAIHSPDGCPICLAARLAEAEACIKQIAHDDLEFGPLSMSACARRLMDAFLTPADQPPSACDHEWLNASNFEPGPNERCWKCSAIRTIADQPPGVA